MKFFPSALVVLVLYSCGTDYYIRKTVRYKMKIQGVDTLYYPLAKDSIWTYRRVTN
jgi:hypothetical protein